MHLLTSTVTHPVLFIKCIFGLYSCNTINTLSLTNTEALLLEKLLEQVSSHLSVIAIVYNVCQYFNTYIHKSTIGE